ncbi:MAG: glycosyltransferase family 2 protein [Bacteroidetes bacterium]|nr:glycosyltransferase family 2 protein [Bacteroidota bacterium]
MSDLPKISIITPSYNQGQYIEQTIQSVLNQNYPNLEYIIIDGGSTDNTVEIIKKYESKITYWVSEKDRGQSHAINKGIEKCTGVLFNWINSDDYLEPGALHKIAETYLATKANIIIGTTKIENVNTGEKSEFVTKEFDSLGKTISRINFWQPSVYVLLEDVIKVGKTTEALHYGMDTEMYIKILLMKGHKGIKVIPDVISHYRIHESSKTGSLLNKFHGDVSSVFYQLALSVGDKKNAEKISEVIAKNQIVKNYSIQLPFNYSSENIKALGENKVYDFLNLLYYDKTIANKEIQMLTKKIDFSLLEPADQSIAKKIAFRMKFFPWLRTLKLK